MDVLEDTPAMTLGSFKVEHDFEDSGCGSFTRYSLISVDAQAPDAKIEEWVHGYYPAERCQHEYDCCGHYYPSRADWARVANIEPSWRPAQPRSLVLVRQGWFQNV